MDGDASSEQLKQQKEQSDDDNNNESEVGHDIPRHVDPLCGLEEVNLCTPKQNSEVKDTDEYIRELEDRVARHVNTEASLRDQLQRALSPKTESYDVHYRDHVDALKEELEAHKAVAAALRERLSDREDALADLADDVEFWKDQCAQYSHEHVDLNTKERDRRTSPSTTPSTRECALRASCAVPRRGFSWGNVSKCNNLISQLEAAISAVPDACDGHTTGAHHRHRIRRLESRFTRLHNLLQAKGILVDGISPRRALRRFVGSTPETWRDEGRPDFFSCPPKPLPKLSCLSDAISAFGAVDPEDGYSIYSRYVVCDVCNAGFPASDVADHSLTCQPTGGGFAASRPTVMSEEWVVKQCMVKLEQAASSGDLSQLPVYAYALDSPLHDGGNRSMALVSGEGHNPFTSAAPEDECYVKAFWQFESLLMASLSALPVFKGTVFRLVKVGSEGGEMPSMPSVGQILTWTSPTSCTRDLRVLAAALSGARGEESDSDDEDFVVLAIHCHAGRAIHQFSPCPEEHEVVMMANTQVRVLPPSVVCGRYHSLIRDQMGIECLRIVDVAEVDLNFYLDIVRHDPPVLFPEERAVLSTSSLMSTITAFEACADPAQPHYVPHRVCGDVHLCYGHLPLTCTPPPDVLATLAGLSRSSRESSVLPGTFALFIRQLPAKDLTAARGLDTSVPLTVEALEACAMKLSDTLSEVDAMSAYGCLPAAVSVVLSLYDKLKKVVFLSTLPRDGPSAWRCNVLLFFCFCADGRVADATRWIAKNKRNAHFRKHIGEAFFYVAATGDPRVLHVLQRHYPSTQSTPPVDAVGLTPMHIAAQFGRVDTLRALTSCEWYPWVAATTPRGRTALHVACDADQHEVVRYLAAHCTRLGLCQDYRGITPLMVAVSHDSVSNVDELIEAQDVVDDRERSALYWALSRGGVQTSLYLLENAPHLQFFLKDNGATVLHAAAKLGAQEMFRRLLTQMTAVDGGTQLLRAQTDDGTTCLHIAAGYGHLGIVQSVVAVDPGMAAIVDACSLTPTCLAALRGHKAVVLYMLGLHHNAVQEVVGACLVEASRGGHLVLCKTLVSTYTTSVKPNVLRLSFHIACQHNHINVARYFAGRCTLNGFGADKETPRTLTAAAGRGYGAVAALLATHGCTGHSQQDDDDKNNKTGVEMWCASQIVSPLSEVSLDSFVSHLLQSGSDKSLEGGNVESLRQPRCRNGHLLCDPAKLRRRAWCAPLYPRCTWCTCRLFTWEVENIMCCEWCDDVMCSACVRNCTARDGAACIPQMLHLALYSRQQSVSLHIYNALINSLSPDGVLETLILACRLHAVLVVEEMLVKSGDAVLALEAVRAAASSGCMAALKCALSIVPLSTMSQKEDEGVLAESVVGACAGGHAEIVRHIMHHKGNSSALLARLTTGEMSPLHSAVKSGSVATVSAVLHFIPELSTARHPATGKTAEEAARDLGLHVIADRIVRAAEQQHMNEVKS